MVGATANAPRVCAAMSSAGLCSEGKGRDAAAAHEVAGGGGLLVSSGLAPPGSSHRGAGFVGHTAGLELWSDGVQRRLAAAGRAGLVPFVALLEVRGGRVQSNLAALHTWR
jgi:hypothetical protein